MPGSSVIVGKVSGVSGDGTFKDLSVQGDLEFGAYGLNLVGDLSFQGTVEASASSNPS